MIGTCFMLADGTYELIVYPVAHTSLEPYPVAPSVISIYTPYS